VFFFVEENIEVCFLQVISVEETTASFLGTKVEVKMKKAEPGSWAKLNFPRQVSQCHPKKILRDFSPGPFQKGAPMGPH